MQITPSQPNPSLYDLNAEVLFFPVRHHSPAAAKLLRQLIHDRTPAAILIEGPSNFNDRLAELHLPHELPIALYSYIHSSDNQRRGAFYPFCLYSPEWQALQTAHQLNIPTQFIDLPWAERSTDRAIDNGYSDETLKRADYITLLCEKLGVEDFDAIWDTLFEIDPELTLEQYLERCHQFCYHLRQTDSQISASDLARETFMAQQIQQAIATYSGQILVVTGGFHSSALHELIQTEITPLPTPSFNIIAQGIALTPYTYDRLDQLTGYQSGMPNPGFYHTVWQNRQAKSAIAPILLQQVVKSLRQQKQIASTADLIAVQTLAQGLADLRGHHEIWRLDLIDGIIGGLVKDDRGIGGSHPFLTAIYEIFRGDACGRLAAGTPSPPLVQDLQARLRSLDLWPTATSRTIDLDLTPKLEATTSNSREASALLHCARILAIDGIRRVSGTDFVARSDLSELSEQWQLQWSPNFDASSIEAAIYGATVEEATIAKLQERADRNERNAEEATLLLLDAALAGVDAQSDELAQRLIQLIHQDGNFLSLSKSLQHLLYLYRYDEILGTQRQTHIAQLLAIAFERGLWLLDSLGCLTGEEDNLLKGLGHILAAYERSGQLLTGYRESLIQVLTRVSQDSQQMPILRGGAIGALWILGETPIDQILAILRYYAQPEMLGDFLTGLFHLARETTQRDTRLIMSIDDLVLHFSDDQFLEALPALRLAFSYFTPREKHQIAKTLLQTENHDLSTDDILQLPVSPATAAQAIAFEARLFELVNRYGIRGGNP